MIFLFSFFSLSFLIPKFKVKIGRDIARGCNWIQSLGILHRDLKSSNILVSFKGGEFDVRVCDFGLSQGMLVLVLVLVLVVVVLVLVLVVVVVVVVLVVVVMVMLDSIECLLILLQCKKTKS